MDVLSELEREDGGGGGGGMVCFVGGEWLESLGGHKGNLVSLSWRRGKGNDILIIIIIVLIGCYSPK